MEQTIAYLNSNDGTGLIAVGRKDSLRLNRVPDLKELDSFIEKYQDSYVFVALSYDLKNPMHGIPSTHEDPTMFPDALLWIPEFVVKLHEDNPTVLPEGLDPSVINELLNPMLGKSDPIILQPRTSKEKYLEHVNSIKEELQQGAIYELNYCQEFFAENTRISDPIALYHKLNARTSAPFSAYVHFDEFRILCASPERFLLKNEDRLLSQPIKGTITRGKNEEEDLALKKRLKEDQKERSENIMIVDLVRNDLAQISVPGSVQVDELCEIYSFRNVHQMISTISCTLKAKSSFSSMLTATFPMGSMTGAPKRRAMQLIESHEEFKRGLYSGSIGYIDPQGNFDLNVVIRTLIWNAKTNYLSCAVGSAVTIKSEPEKEYEECLTKIRFVLNTLDA